MKHGWMALAGLVLVSSTWPLGQVLVDRSTPPRMQLQVTHRELTPLFNREEKTGIVLTWNWTMGAELDSVDAGRLEAMGLRCHSRSYDCGLRGGRPGYMVVTLDTATWHRRIDSLQGAIDSIDRLGRTDSTTARDRRERVSRMDWLTRMESRLLLVDAGRDPDALLARWNDGAHLILPARLTAYSQGVVPDSLAERRWYRVHAEPRPQGLYVPDQWAPLITDSAGFRNYVIEVAVGRGWLPRVAGVTR